MKKGAFELGVGTMVIIVIAVLILVLGIVFVSNIFKGGTENIDTLNKKVTAKIQNLFGEENDDVVVMLGPDRKARIKPSDETFGIAIGARKDGTVTSRDDLKFKLTLGTDPFSSDCLTKLGGVENVKKLFMLNVDIHHGFDAYEADSAYAIINLKVPEGTPTCTQKVDVDVVDSVNNPIGGDFFQIEIIKGGFAFL